MNRSPPPPKEDLSTSPGNKVNKFHESNTRAKPRSLSFGDPRIMLVSASPERNAGSAILVVKLSSLSREVIGSRLAHEMHPGWARALILSKKAVGFPKTGSLMPALSS